MSPTDYADHGHGIARAFQKYLKSGDERLIKNYTAKELRTAVSQLSPYYNTNKLWYRTLERRLEVLSRIEGVRRRHFIRLLEAFKEKWFSKVIMFALGLALGIIFF